MKISHELQWTPDEKKYFKILQNVKYLVVHHTKSGDVPVEEIHRWHKNRVKDPFIGCGYHFLIRTNGDIEGGRPENIQGAHVGAEHNKHSIGIALCGDFMKTVPAAAQICALEDILTALRVRYPGAQVVAHRMLSATACPGKMFPWNELIQALEGEKPMPEKTELTREQKQKIMDEGRKAGLITSDHDPEGKSENWYPVAVALNLLKVLKGEGK